MRAGTAAGIAASFVAGLAASLAGCFGPTIPSGAFRCADDSPRCPEGQVCDEATTLCVTAGAAGDAGPGDAVSDLSLDQGKGPPDLEGSPPPAGEDGAGCEEDDVEEDPDPPAVGPIDMNATFPTATSLEDALPFPFARTGLEICWADDVDYYQVPLSEGDRLEVRVVFAHTMGDLDAVLQDPDGIQIDVQQGTLNDEVLTMAEPAPEQEAGDAYRFAVIGYAGATNRYSLNVRLLEE